MKFAVLSVLTVAISFSSSLTYAAQIVGSSQSCEAIYAASASSHHLDNVVFTGIAPQFPSKKTEVVLSKVKQSVNYSLSFDIEIFFPGHAPISTTGRCDDDQGDFGFVSIYSPGPKSILGDGTFAWFSYSSTQYLLSVGFAIRGNPDRDSTLLSANRKTSDMTTAH